MKSCKLLLFLIIAGLFMLSSCKKVEKEMLVTTGSVSNILTTTADVTGNILDLGEGATNYGHCYSKTPNPGISGPKSEYSSPFIGGFTSALAGLDPGTKYYTKAFLRRGDNVVFGNEITFTTASATLPVLTTDVITGITKTQAVGGGNISSQGGTPVTARGVCWRTTTNPTISDNKTENGSGTGAFSGNLSGLTAGTKYYVRAYATNDAGTGYGNEVSFTTSPEGLALPVVTISAISEVTSSTASCGGEVTSIGGASVTQRGVCWSKTANPTILNFLTNDGSGLGIFSSMLSDLEPGTTYYIRAYATNSGGTAYSTNEISFITKAVLPSISTSPVNSITNISAKSGGAVTSNGGALIIARGVCWSPNIDPTPQVPNGYTSEETGGGGTGSFTSDLSTLSPKTLYYVRAYATNSMGTAYGDPLTFTTLGPPTSSTLSASNLSNTGAILNGNVIAFSTSATISFEYGITTGYGTTVAATPGTAGGLTETSVSAAINGLVSGQIYHYRVKSVNIYGTTYGSDIAFTTTVQDRSGNNYNIVTIGTQVWMKENLKTSKFKDGTNIPNVVNNTSWQGLTTPGYCFYNNDDYFRTKTSYGALYNWYAVNTNNLCPDGWHAPVSSDFTTITNFLTDNGFGYGGSGSDIAKALASTDKWTASATAGVPGNDMASNNASQFTALPGGCREMDGTFNSMLTYGYWWSTYSVDVGSATARRIYYNGDSFLHNAQYKKMGFSVRCVRDQ